MCVTSFIEGVTARRPDNGVFFLLGLKIGHDEFVILTTDARKTDLLGERALKSEGYGSGRCPIYATGADAAQWVDAATAEAAAEVALSISEGTQANLPGLVLGAAARGAVAPAAQPPLAALWGKAVGSVAKKRKPDAEGADHAKRPKPSVDPTIAASPPSPKKGLLQYFKKNAREEKGQATEAAHEADAALGLRQHRQSLMQAIIEMGFEEHSALAALEATGWQDVETALGRLL